MARRTIEDVPIGESFEMLFELVEKVNRQVEEESPVAGMVVGATRMHVERCREWLKEQDASEPVVDLPGDWEEYFNTAILEIEMAKHPKTAKDIALRMARYLLNVEIDEGVAQRGRDVINMALERR